MNIDWNSASVINDRNGVVDVNRNANFIAVACQRFVYGVINDFINEVVKPHFSGRANIHGRPEPNGLKTFEDLDTTRIIIVVLSHCTHTSFRTGPRGTGKLFLSVALLSDTHRHDDVAKHRACRAFMRAQLARAVSILEAQFHFALVN
jgi:hypothetical protein